MCRTDDCDEGRRAFLTNSAAAVIGLTTLNSIGQQTQPWPHNEKVTTRVLDDPTITHGTVMFQHNKTDTIDGFLARPKAEGKYPVVIVIAGNVITEEYIPNTCAALAVAGYVGLAPNIFHTLTPEAKTPEERRKATVGHSDSDALLDINSGLDYLRKQPFASFDSIGVVGFCYGGKLAMMLGSRLREVDAVVPYHPGPVTDEDIARLNGPVLIHQGTADKALPKGQTEELEKRLKKRKVPTQVFWYEGADHGFLAYTRPFYKPDYAKLSWERTIAFLNRHLKRSAR
ncbi:MAG: dienelactone hydrolase family protein [Chloracidobacterium sp.]|nr:dienelactone hydrolase family protein [Chloracidobacterium sp.]